MESKAVARFIRVSPNKARQVADLIRGKDLSEALAVLKYLPHGASLPIYKTVKSAAANAEHNYEMDADSLYISKIFIDQGPTLKRFKPRARGRADSIRKKTSHITVVVSGREEVN